MTTALTQYESAAKSFAQRDQRDVNGYTGVPEEESSSLAPSTPSDYDTMPLKDRMMPLDRLASLSQQISILESKMAECKCKLTLSLQGGRGRGGRSESVMAVPGHDKENLLKHTCQFISHFYL